MLSQHTKNKRHMTRGVRRILEGGGKHLPMGGCCCYDDGGEQETDAVAMTMEVN